MNSVDQTSEEQLSPPPKKKKKKKKKKSQMAAYSASYFGLLNNTDILQELTSWTYICQKMKRRQGVIS